VAVQLDLSMLVALDTTGLDSLEQLLKAVQKKEGSLSAYYLQPQPRSLMERTGFIKHLHRCS
jgi:SulP family sulfate permease